MCISTKPRTFTAVNRRPAVDAAQLLSHVNIKPAQLAEPEAISSFMAEPATGSSCSNTAGNINTSATGKKRNRHITVVHNYHDHSHDCRADYQQEHPARGGVTTPFPLKLHDMLVATAAEGMDDIVSWQPHGRCFVVHKPKEFVSLLPRFFKLSKLASFQRQLNLYGFQRLTRGNDRGGYYHEFFLHNRVFLAHSIQRIKVKGTGVRARSNPAQEPDFWSMGWVSDDEQPPSTVMYSPPKSTMSMPVPQPQSSFFNKVEDDVVIAFGTKTFHYLDLFQTNEQEQQKQKQQQPIVRMPTTAVTSANNWSEVDQLLSEDADSFFEGFDFPDYFCAEIEDDLVFANLLDQLIA